MGRPAAAVSDAGRRGASLRDPTARKAAPGWLSRRVGLAALARWHRPLVAAILASSVVAQRLWGPVDLLDRPLLAAILILVLAVPHGALDMEIMKRRWGLTRRLDVCGALAAYVGVAALVLAAWWLSSGFALTAFLLVSALHFGDDLLPERGERSVPGLARRFVMGAALLSSVAALHQDEVARVFGWLASDRAATTDASLLHAAAPALLVAAAILLAQEARRSTAQVVETVILLAAAAVLPPITFFVLYFCLLHSLRHLIHARAELVHRPAAELARSSWLYAVLPIAGCAVGAWLVRELGSGPALISSVFVTLAALTVPHMLFVDFGPPRRRA